MANVATLLERVCKTTGEGPHWDERRGQLLFVDIDDFSVHRWTLATNTHESHKFDSYCTLVVPNRKGGYIVSVGKSICHFNWESKALTTLATVDDGKNTRVNDGKCDASGRLWFGTMVLGGPEYQGSLYSLELDGTVRKHKEGVNISNGLAWTEDNSTMFYIDSTPRKVYGYDFELATGTMSNERIVLDFSTLDTTMPELGVPDGMNIDNDGKLWVACYLGRRVIRVDPTTGNVIGSITLPANRVTSCCFGGKNFDEMFITSGRSGASADELQTTPLAGSVFHATGLGASGKAAYIYEG